MKRKLLAICLAGLIILQLEGMTIFARNQDPEPIIAGEATIEVEPIETKAEQDEKNESQTISIDVIETISDIITNDETVGTSSRNRETVREFCGIGKNGYSSFK